MPCMSASGNISPQSMSRMRGVAVVLLDRHAVAADLPEPAEEDDADGLGHATLSGVVGRTARDRASGNASRQRCRFASTSAARSASHGGRRPSAGGPGRRAGRGGAASPWSGSGFGASSPVSNAKLSSSRALTGGRRHVALLPAGRTSPDESAPVQCVATPISADGAARRAAAASSRRRRCRPRSRRARRRSARPSRRGCRRRPSAPTMLATSRASRSSVAVVILRPVRTGMS